MKKLIGLGAVVALAAVFALAGVAEAAQGGNGKGRKKTNAIAGSVGEMVICSADGVPEGTILVGEDFSQCFTYTLSLTGVADGTVAHEVISSTFDLSSDAEDEANDGVTDGLDEADQEDTADDGVCHDPNNLANVVNCIDFIGLGGTDSFACADGACDGIVLDDGCAVGDCDGIAVTGESGGTCTVNLAQPDSAIKKNDGAIPPKQEEILNIEVASDSGTVACDVQVWVETVGNPGSVSFDVDEVKVPDCDDGMGAPIADCTFDSEGNLAAGENVVFLVYEPASCTPLRRHTRFDADGDGEADDPENPEPFAGIICTDGDACMTDGVPIVEYVEVNRGAMFFDKDGVLELAAGDFAAIVGGSIQLKPLGCDTDGDGVTDADEVTGSTDPLDPLSN